MSVVAGRPREQKHQANRLFTPGFYPHHSLQNMTLVALSQLQLIQYAAAELLEGSISLLSWCPYMTPCQPQKSFKIFTVHKALCCLAYYTVGLRSAAVLHQQLLHVHVISFMFQTPVKEWQCYFYYRSQNPLPTPKITVEKVYLMTAYYVIKT